MSLFDVIRYPIDIQFQLESLDAIPYRIVRDWWYWAYRDGYARWPSGNLIPPTITNIRYHLYNHASPEHRLLLLDKLRHMIEEYEDVII